VKPTRAQLRLLHWLAGDPGRRLEVDHREPGDTTGYTTIARHESLPGWSIVRPQTVASMIARGWLLGTTLDSIGGRPGRVPAIAYSLGPAGAEVARRFHFRTTSAPPPKS
jgi:hypothetical protein